MSLTFPLLLGLGGLFAAAAIALHLLNLRQRKPIKWAAMQLLLESERKSRRWVKLKDLLLMAARALLMLLLGLLAARPFATSSVARWFAAEPTHHVVLLDDTLSMGEEGDERSVWGAAQRALGKIIASARAAGGAQRLTVVRLSECAWRDAATGKPSLTASITSGAPSALDRQLEGWAPSQSAAPLATGLTAVRRFVQDSPAGERTLAYVLSDFRRSSITPAAEFSASCEATADSAAALNLIACAAGNQHANGTITSLRLEPAARAAGVEMRLDVTVQNNGELAAAPTNWSLQRDEQRLPLSPLPALPPQESVRRSIPITFDSPGPHILTVELAADALPGDNRRSLGVVLAPSRRVLLIGEGLEPLFFGAALRPSGAVQTGWAPEVLTAEAAAQGADFTGYTAVLLLDAPRLDERLVAKLVRFLEAGGGVFLELGPRADRSLYNRVALGPEKHQEAGRLAAWRLDLPTQAELAPVGQAAIVAAEHPLTAVLTGVGKQFLPQVQVTYHHTLAEAPTESERFAVPLRTASGAPLMVVDRQRPGSLVTLLTATARAAENEEPWSNLSTAPFFPIFVNELAAYLAEPQLREVQQPVATKWSPSTNKPEPVFYFDSGQFRPTTLLETPTGPAGPLMASGVYRRGTESPGAPPQLCSVNVEPAEGALASAPLAELRRMLKGDTINVFTASELDSLPEARSASPLGAWLAIGLLALAAGELLLALASSYLRPKEVAR